MLRRVASQIYKYRHLCITPVFSFANLLDVRELGTIRKKAILHEKVGRRHRINFFV